MSVGTLTRTVSDIWYHFTKLDKKGKCRYCYQLISCPSGSSSNLKRHLKSKHPTVPLERGNRSRAPLSGDGDELDEIEEILPLKSFSSSILAESLHPETGSDIPTASQDPGPSCSFLTHSSSTRQSNINKFVNIIKPITPNQSVALDTQLLKMICKEYQPFSIVENVEFKKFVNMLCPNYNLPSRKTLSNSLLPGLFYQLFNKIKNDLLHAKAVSLTADGWTNINNVSFYALTAHFIDNNTKLKSYLLECSEFEGRHTSENIAAWVNDVCKKFEIHYKITAIITDKASNMKLSAKRLNFPHLPCFAHSLNLVVQNAIQVSIHKIVYEVKRTVLYFKKSSFALSKLVEMQENLKMEKLKLKQDVPTRWNSTYDMLQRFLNNKEAIISCLAILGTKLFNFSLKDTDWEIVKQSVNILKIFEEVTREILSEKNVSLSKMAILSTLMVRQLRTYEEKNRDLPPEIAQLTTELLKGLSERFGFIANNELILQAMLLDPRFKKQGFSEESLFQECYNSVASKMKVLIAQQTNHQISQTSSVTTLSENISIWKEFDETLNQLQGMNDPRSTAIVELDKYLSEAYLSRTQDPLIWWESRKLLYPALYELVLKRLCIPATSVPCERIFSKAGQICTEKRNCLNSSKMTQILFLNNNSD